VRANESMMKDIEIVEWALTGVFVTELLLRILSDTVFPWRMLRSFIFWLEVMACLPMFISLTLRMTLEESVYMSIQFRLVGVYGFLQTLRVLKLFRRYTGWRVLMLAINRSWRPMIVPGVAMMVTFVLSSLLLYVAEGAEQSVFDDTGVLMPGYTQGEDGVGFVNAFECLYVTFWLVTTLGYDGFMGNGNAGGRVVIGITLVCGLIFTTMPITIVGEAFTHAWETREQIIVEQRLRQLLVSRELSPQDLHIVFDEFDTDGNSHLDWSEFKDAMTKLKVNLSIDDQRKVFKRFDREATGTIQFRDFCAVMYPTLDYERDVKVLPQKCRKRATHRRAATGETSGVSATSDQTHSAVSSLSSTPSDKASRADSRCNAMLASARRRSASYIAADTTDANGLQSPHSAESAITREMSDADSTSATLRLAAVESELKMLVTMVSQQQQLLQHLAASLPAMRS